MEKAIRSLLLGYSDRGQGPSTRYEGDFYLQSLYTNLKLFKLEVVHLLIKYLSAQCVQDSVLSALGFGEFCY